VRKFVLCFLLSLGVALSQGNTGLLSGVVTDPTGSAVPGADVSVTNVDTGQIVRTTSNEKGEYSFPSMPPGNYRVSVSKAGFKTETRRVWKWLPAWRQAPTSSWR
jgi:protocatechuate 3,4-dioxygenase beta subunit